MSKIYRTTNTNRQSENNRVPVDASSPDPSSDSYIDYEDFQKVRNRLLSDNDNSYTSDFSTDELSPDGQKREIARMRRESAAEKKLYSRMFNAFESILK